MRTSDVATPFDHMCRVDHRLLDTAAGVPSALFAKLESTGR